MTGRAEQFLTALAPGAPSDAPYRVHAEPIDGDANWDDGLEALHEESSRTHFLDVWTRRSLIEEISPAVRGDAVIADLGCSTGYLLSDLHARWPQALTVGVDLVASGLIKAHVEAPAAELILGDVTKLPFGDGTVDAVVSANLLEHVPDDLAALREIHRVLKPGGRAAVIVPSGPTLYDYYDRFLHHERRYGRHELAFRAQTAGLTVLRDAYIGSFIYPPFWAVKKRNRRKFASLRGADLTARVAQDIKATSESKLGYSSCALERALVRRGVTIPFGVRSMIVVQRGNA
jgi:SAM-dependent methyltransferase